MGNEQKLQEALDQMTIEKEQLAQDNARLREVVILGKAKAFVSGKLADMDAPELTKARLTESLSKNPPVKDGELDEAAYEKVIEEAVEAEMAYLSEITGSGDIKGMGGGGSPPGPDTEAEAKLRETWKEHYMNEGYSAEEADIMAEKSLRGR